MLAESGKAKVTLNGWQHRLRLLFPLRAPGLVSGSAGGSGGHLEAATDWGAGVVSKHREEAAVLFFLLTLKSTSPNRHVNRLFRITDQTPTATDTFSPVFVGTSTC